MIGLGSARPLCGVWYGALRGTFLDFGTAETASILIVSAGFILLYWFSVVPKAANAYAVAVCLFAVYLNFRQARRFFRKAVQISRGQEGYPTTDRFKLEESIAQDRRWLE